MNRFTLPRLVPGLFGIALAALLGAAHGHAPPAAFGPAAAWSRVALAGLPVPGEPALWATREHIPKAPPAQAARTRRPAPAVTPGILPAAIAAPALAPAILVIGSSIDRLVLPSEFGHYDVAARPPPTS